MFTKCSNNKLSTGQAEERCGSCGREAIIGVLFI